MLFTVTTCDGVLVGNEEQTKLKQFIATAETQKPHIGFLPEITQQSSGVISSLQGSQWWT